MYFTNESLIFGIEGELQEICNMLMDAEGRLRRPTEKHILYALCMSMIRICAMIDRISPAIKGEYPHTRWEQVQAVGRRYATYPLTMDAGEILALLDGEIPMFMEQIHAIVSDIEDTMPY